MKTNRQLAQDILKELGGAENITHSTHCVTRLRVNLADESKANLDALKTMDGTMGAQIKDDQWQIIIGPKVGDVYMEFKSLLGDRKAASDDAAESGKKFNLLDTITGIFSPIIPALVAGGIVKGLLAIVAGFGVDTGADDWAIFNMISDIPFYFLPFLLAVSSARKFRVNEFLALVVAGSLLYPAFTAAMESGDVAFTLFGIAVPQFSYASSVFPVIFGVAGLSLVYHAIDRFVPDLFKLVVVPALSLMIVIRLTSCCSRPLAHGVASALRTASSGCSPRWGLSRASFWAFSCPLSCSLACISRPLRSRLPTSHRLATTTCCPFRSVIT